MSPNPDADAPSPPAALRAELHRLSLLVQIAIRRAVREQDYLEGEYDLRRMRRDLSRLGQAQGGALPSREPDPRDDEELLQLRAELAASQAAAAALARPDLPLPRLRERAHLDDLSMDLLLLALAPDIDEAFVRVYGWMKFLKARPQVDVASAALVLTPEDPGAGRLRRLLSPGQPLFDLGLLELAPRDEGCTLATTLRAPPLLSAFLLGQPTGDGALRAFVYTDQPAPAGEERYWPAAQGEQLQVALREPGALPLLEGPAGAGKRDLLRSHFAPSGGLVEVVVRDAPGRLSADEVQRVLRLLVLRGAALCLVLPPLERAPSGSAGSGGERADKEGAPPWAVGVLQLLQRHRGPVVLCRDTAEEGVAHGDLSLPPGRYLVPIALRHTTAAVREGLWRRHLGDTEAELDLALLARNFPIPPRTIMAVARQARLLAAAAGRRVGQADVLARIEDEYRASMQAVGRRLTTSLRMGDLVLAQETRDTLLEMHSTLRTRHHVLDDWGLGRLLRGRGLSALFYGEPGTGKTQAASVLAESVGLLLYQVDTSQLVSKWVGETEKNLARVFRAAEASHAMLLFDEADSIFGKRTEVQDSNDRYANLQTNFLLTMIEGFNGVVILTTNKESVMDPAFQRRITFRVFFPMPEEDEREELWRRMIAACSAPKAEIQYRELARRLGKMSGGYIRNAVLRGAHLAAAAGQPLSTPLLRRAAELVLRDAGRLI